MSVDNDTNSNQVKVVGGGAIELEAKRGAVTIGEWRCTLIKTFHCHVSLSKLNITRRILDILYSAQHGNQHKDALA